jgi:hypothetical protein
MNLYPISTGGRTDLTVQVEAYGGLQPGAFELTDILTSALYALGNATPVFAPSATWYTAGNTQTGYSQGQITASVTIAQAALLVPSVRYILMISRAPVGNSSDTDIVAYVFLIAKAPWNP